MRSRWFISAANLLLALHTPVQAVNFPWEQEQLSESDIGSFAAIAFGNQSAAATRPQPKCRTSPGDVAWPSLEEWNRFNSSLGGALIKTVPRAAVCYPTHPLYHAQTCTELVKASVKTETGTADPSTIFSSWLQGNTCALTDHPAGNCTLGGFPVYIINATSVKHVQMGVNFARNHNIRLVVK